MEQAETSRILGVNTACVRAPPLVEQSQIRQQQLNNGNKQKRTLLGTAAGTTRKIGRSVIILSALDQRMQFKQTGERQILGRNPASITYLASQGTGGGLEWRRMRPRGVEGGGDKKHDAPLGIDDASITGNG